jgi:RimJ/RimL family protein N-acetyltransferase
MLTLDEAQALTCRDSRRLTVRRLRTADAEALQRFNRELSEPSRRWFLPHPYDDETVGRVLQRSEAGEDLTLGLFDGLRLVGYFFLWYVRRRVPLLGIGLVDDLQGQGLGRPMLELLIAQARAAGCEAIELTTMLDNDRAFALYRKVGFEHFKDVENLQGNGEWVVERAMIYRLQPHAVPMQEPHRPPV